MTYPPPFPPSSSLPKSGRSAQDEWEGGWSRDGFGDCPFENGIFRLSPLCYTLNRHDQH